MALQRFLQQASIRRALARLDTPARFFGAYAAALVVLALVMVGLGALSTVALNFGVTAVFAILSLEVVLTAVFAGVALAGPTIWIQRRRGH